MPDIHGLTPEEARILRELVAWWKGRSTGTARRPDPGYTDRADQQASDSFIVKTPANGIPAYVPGAGTGSSLTAPWADCQVYHWHRPSGTLFAIPGLTKRVYNPFSEAVTGGAYVIICKDKAGAWNVAAPPSAGSAGQTDFVRATSYLKVGLYLPGQRCRFVQAGEVPDVTDCWIIDVNDDQLNTADWFLARRVDDLAGVPVYVAETDREFPALILGGRNPYAFSELIPIAGGGFDAHPTPRTGANGYEVNGNSEVPANSVVWMRRGFGIISGVLGSREVKDYRFAYEGSDQGAFSLTVGETDYSPLVEGVDEILFDYRVGFVVIPISLTAVEITLSLTTLTTGLVTVGGLPTALLQTWFPPATSGPWGQLSTGNPFLDALLQSGLFPSLLTQLEAGGLFGPGLTTELTLQDGSLVPRLTVKRGCLLTFDSLGNLTVDQGALAGPGLTLGPPNDADEHPESTCYSLAVRTGCGTWIDDQDAVAFYAPEVARDGLVPVGTCGLAVFLGDGLTFDEFGAVILDMTGPCQKIVTDVACVNGSLVVTFKYARFPKGTTFSDTPCPPNA